MLSQNIELPFLPQYKTEQIGDGPTIKVTWFEPRFSQSHYKIHNRSNGSNACTLIVIIMAYKCHTYNVIVNDPNENLNIRLIHLLAISMLEGNAIHEELQLKNLLNDPNLNVPEALKYTKQKSSNLVEWKSAIYMERLSRSLYDNIRHNYKEWLKSAKNPYEDLYVLLIADSRTVLFLFQAKSNTISLFDSHQHTMEQGAFIAITNLDHMGYLCFWFKEVMKRCYNSDPKLYELSFLYFKK